MYVIVLTYRRPLEEVDRLLDEHVAFLDAQFAAGRFLAAGRRVPRTGGVILAPEGARAELEAALRDDPFHREGIADYENHRVPPHPHGARLEPGGAATRRRSGDIPRHVTREPAARRSSAGGLLSLDFAPNRCCERSGPARTGLRPRDLGRRR